MNFKTTIVLIVLLAVAALALFFTRDSSESRTADSPDVSAEGEKLLAIGHGDVTKLTIAPSSGDTLSLEKIDGAWKLTSPVSAPVDSFAVDSLVQAVVDLRARGSVDATSTMSLDDPSYTVTVDGKEHSAKLVIGSKSTVGNTLYVGKGESASTAYLVDASLLEQLEKPASDYREKQLVQMASTDVKQVEVMRPSGKLVLHRVGNEWKVIEPTPMPAETSEVTDLINGVTGLQAEEFVSDNADYAGRYQLDQPEVTVTLSTLAPATQPATAPASAPAESRKTVKFGRYADVMKEKIYVTVAGTATVATVPANSLEKFTVPAISLRDRDVLDIDPDQVSKVVIERNLAATTQPTTRPASIETITVERRDEVVALGPTSSPATTQATTHAATTQGATQPATTQASTAPAPSKWQLTSTTQPADASDSRIATLLASLHPLRATEYLETAPTTQPSATYTLTMTTLPPGGAAAQTHVIKLTDRGTSEAPVAEANGLVFEVDRSLLTKVEGDFNKGAAAPEESLPEPVPPQFAPPQLN